MGGNNKEERKERKEQINKNEKPERKEERKRGGKTERQKKRKKERTNASKRERKTKREKRQFTKTSIITTTTTGRSKTTQGCFDELATHGSHDEAGQSIPGVHLLIATKARASRRAQNNAAFTGGWLSTRLLSRVVC